MRSDSKGLLRESVPDLDMETGRKQDMSQVLKDKDCNT